MFCILVLCLAIGGDKITLHDGTELDCTIRKINPHFIEYTLPKSQVWESISVFLIDGYQLGEGERRNFERLPKVKNKFDLGHVILVDAPEAVKGLRLIGTIRGSSVSEEKGRYILQRRAAKKRAQIVFVKEFRKVFMGWEFSGQAYSID